MVWWTRVTIIALAGILLGLWVGFGRPPQAIAPSEPVPSILENVPGPATSTTEALPATAPKETAETGAGVSQTPGTGTAPREAAPTPKPKKEVAATPSPTPVKPEQTPAPQSPSEAVQNAVTSLTDLGTTTTAGTPSLSETVRASLVNIVCVTQTGGPLNSISASGVIIDSRGVILTNSHVAQFFLLQDYPVKGFLNCIIRTGSPAYPRYTAELLFMPPTWVADNAYKITEEKPLGNGEHDYALLRITGTAGPSVEMPTSFPYLAVSTTPPEQSQSILVAGYPAGFLGGITIATNLYASSAGARIGDVFTFGGSTLDLFSVGGTIVDQQGASGGAVTDANGTLIGLIVTATDAPDTAARDLRAIATSYIVGDFQKEAGVSLANYLSGDIAQEARTFNLGVAPTLRQELVNAIQNPQP